MSDISLPDVNDERHILEQIKALRAEIIRKLRDLEDRIKALE